MIPSAPSAGTLLRMGRDRLRHAFLWICAALLCACGAAGQTRPELIDSYPLVGDLAECLAEPAQAPPLPPPGLRDEP